MGTGLHREHDVLLAEHTGHGVHSSRDGLSEQDQVGLDAAPLVAQKLASTGNAGLDLVADEQDVVLVAQSAGFLEVLYIWYNDTSLTLNRLDQEGSQVGAGLLKGLSE